MKNPYTCDNCLLNPTQYQEVGTKVGYCLKHDRLLKNSSHTTCHYFRRKDLPFFIAEDGHEEHAKEFPSRDGIVFYHSKYEEEPKHYSERHAWLTNSYDPHLHEVVIYHRMGKKWAYIQAFLSSRNPIKSVISSSLVRRYVQQCGTKSDNYRLLLSLTCDLSESIEMRMEDFRFEITSEEFPTLKENYLKDIALLKVYAIQEYGAITENEDLMWVTDELNGSLLSSWKEFSVDVKSLAPIVSSYIVAAAQRRGSFFPEQNAEADA
jgi:hypothetical protein